MDAAWVTQAFDQVVQGFELEYVDDHGQRCREALARCRTGRSSCRAVAAVPGLQGKELQRLVVGGHHRRARRL